jgi:hypothetical protein
MRERKKERKCDGGEQTGEEMIEKGGGTWVVGKKKEIKSRCTWVVGKKRKEKRKRKEGGDIQREERKSEEKNEKDRYFESCEKNK